MSADDFSARRSDPSDLAAALVSMTTRGSLPTCAIAVTGAPRALRVARLLAQKVESGRLREVAP
jgi:hypothetical protein